MDGVCTRADPAERPGCSGPFSCTGGPMSGQRVDLTTRDGVMDSYTFRPQGSGSWPAVIVYMDAFGIRPNLDSMAQRLADAGYFVIVPNLYYRTGAFEPFDPKKVFGG